MRALPCLFHESTGPGDWRSCDASRSRLRGVGEDSAPFTFSPFLRFSLPARLSPESRPQGRLFISINFWTISSVLLIRWPPRRERMRERSAQTGRSDAGAFCTSFWMTRLLNLILPRKQRLQRFQSARKHLRTIAQGYLVLRDNSPSQWGVDFSTRPSLCCARRNRSPLTTKFARKMLESTRILRRCLLWGWSHFFFNITNRQLKDSVR